MVFKVKMPVTYHQHSVARWLYPASLSLQLNLCINFIKRIVIQVRFILVTKYLSDEVHVAKLAELLFTKRYDVAANKVFCDHKFEKSLNKHVFEPLLKVDAGLSICDF
jgi:hypothetical protein